MSEEEVTLPKATLPKVGLSKLTPLLEFLGVGRAAHKAGVKAGTFPPARVPSRKPGSPDLYDCAENWSDHDHVPAVRQDVGARRNVVR